MINLEELFPVEKIPREAVRVPAFVEGTLYGALSKKYEEERKGNTNFYFNGSGSNVFINGLVNYVFSQNNQKFRTVVPTDNVYESIFPLIENKLYTDLNAFDVWEKKPNYEKNNCLWKQVIELAEKEEKRKVKFPFRVEGFYIVQDESEKGYGARIIPSPSFRIIEDDRLNLESGTRFNSLDENGMINPNKSGKYILYTLRNGLSRVYLYWDGDLGAGSDNLADSYVNGRVVVVEARSVNSSKIL